MVLLVGVFLSSIFLRKWWFLVLLVYLFTNILPSVLKKNLVVDGWMGGFGEFRGWGFGDLGVCCVFRLGLVEF